MSPSAVTQLQGEPATGALNRVWVGKFRDFRPTSCYILETVYEIDLWNVNRKALVARADQSMSVPSTSNDLENVEHDMCQFFVMKYRNYARIMYSLS